MSLGYDKRNRILKGFGFKTYDAYLNSDLWMKIRAAQLRIQPLCFACGSKATQVHHGKYTKENLAGRSMEHLYSVCGGCHLSAEFKDGGVKTNLGEATVRLKNRRGQLKFVRWQHLEMDREAKARWEREL